jgi:hypothetical protein
MSFFKRALMAISVCLSLSAQAQSLPAGSIGSVQGNTANVFSNYSFSFTPSQSGSDYVGFAFRQDPAFWTFTNPSVTTGGGSNLFVNGNLATGGPVQVTVNGGTQRINAPANWGVWYQNGTYPAAAGTWSAGQWYDGAVGSFDGIYQGIQVTGGLTYTITFRAMSNNVVDNNAIQLGVYAGPCTSLTLAASLCVPNLASMGIIAQPNQTVNAGNPSAPPVAPSAPTVVSTAAGPSIVTTSSVNGVPTQTSITNTNAVTTTDSHGNQVVTTYYTVTTTTTTPVTTTTVTTPVTITTYSDGSTTSTNGTPVTTTSTTNTVTTSTTQPVVLSVATTADVVTTNTQAGQATVQQTATRGTPTVTVQVTDVRAPQARTLNINQNVTTTVDTPVTTTTVTTTPITTVTTHTPTTTTVDANGNVIGVTTATATSTSNTVNQVNTNVALTDSVAVTSQNSVFSTRIDMMNQLATVNSQINSAFTSDPLSRTRINEQGGLSLRNGKDTDVYIIGTGMQTNTINSYQAATGMIGVGADFIVDKDLLLGWQYGHANSTMTGDNAGGSLVKDMFGIYGVQSLDDWLVKFDLGYASNQYGSYHTLPQLGLSNSSTTNGNDYFGSARLYTPDAGKLDDVLSGLRAFVGQGYEHDYVGGVTESGSALTAMSYDPTNTRTWTSEAGIAYYIKLDKDWSLGSELSMNNHNQKTELVSISYKTTDNSSVLLKAITQQTYSGVNNAVQAWARINF